jgi:hypothetical protein
MLYRDTSTGVARLIVFADQRVINGEPDNTWLAPVPAHVINEVQLPAVVSRRPPWQSIQPLNCENVSRK